MLKSLFCNTLFIEAEKNPSSKSYNYKSTFFYRYATKGKGTQPSLTPPNAFNATYSLVTPSNRFQIDFKYLRKTVMAALAISGSVI